MEVKAKIDRVFESGYDYMGTISLFDELSFHSEVTEILLIKIDMLLRRIFLLPARAIVSSIHNSKLLSSTRLTFKCSFSVSTFQQVQNRFKKDIDEEDLEYILNKSSTLTQEEQTEVCNKLMDLVL